MEALIIDELMHLITPLTTELKLELLSKLSDNLKTEFKSNKTEKEILLEELYGAWSDVEDGLEVEIKESRLGSKA
jgi:hypothetical protein